ncbi:HNH endonuclease [Clostridium sp. ZS2-4]|uniref:HNH endonuclease n=1 Tax=Clostridium sp. ZS2-4 TaxID=2987703 RepID=UPI00227C49EA|nr:HNH endonuclease [Clostridium sp. ZS2-4]MCY6354404.1 HNH endonuclease [Clostridium sp. ZS2-4]
MNIKYDVLGFPIFNDNNVKFELKLDKKFQTESDKIQFEECIRQLQEAIDADIIQKEIFNSKQLEQIQAGEVRIEGLRWHHHQITGKMQLVVATLHDYARHLGGKELWGGGMNNE